MPDLRYQARQTVWKPSAEKSGSRQRYFVRLVVGKDRMTFQGDDATWEKLPSLLERTPNRAQTVLEIALGADDLTAREWNEATGRAGELAQRHRFEHLSQIGEHPLGSKGSPPQTLPKGE